MRGIGSRTYLIGKVDHFHSEHAFEGILTAGSEQTVGDGGKMLLSEFGIFKLFSLINICQRRVVSFRDYVGILGRDVNLDYFADTLCRLHLHLEVV